MKQKRLVFIIGSILLLLLLLLCCSLVLVRVIQTELFSSAKTVEVFADEGWQDTNIELQSGDQILIEYLSGEITDADTLIIDGTGSDYVCGHQNCCEPLPNAHRSSLIARIGHIDENIFYVGNGVQTVTDIDGHLFLRVNDCNSGLFDNDGAFQVQITKE